MTDDYSIWDDYDDEYDDDYYDDLDETQMDDDYYDDPYDDPRDRRSRRSRSSRYNDGEDLTQIGFTRDGSGDRQSRSRHDNRGYGDDLTDQKTELPGRRRGGNRYDLDPEENMTRLVFDESEIKPLGFLLVKRPPIRRGHFFKVEGTDRSATTIGTGRRSTINLRGDDTVSGDHAEIWLDKEEDENGEPVFKIFDKRSANGTFVLSKKGKKRTKPVRIKGEHRVHENDEIKIGEYVFVFKVLKD